MVKEAGVAEEPVVVLVDNGEVDGVDVEDVQLDTVQVLENGVDVEGEVEAVEDVPVDDDVGD